MRPQRDAKTQALAIKGQRIYRSRLKAKLEPTHLGEYAVIEVESGDYFLGHTISEAYAKAAAKYPDKEFYLVRIGYPAAISFKHRTSI